MGFVGVEAHRTPDASAKKQATIVACVIRPASRPSKRQLRSSTPQSNVEVGHLQRVVLDERTPWLDHVAHQGREDLVGGDRILDPDLQ